MSTQKEENTCAICWENIGEKNKTITSCGHSFHFNCITKNILKGTGDSTMNCPLCRKLIVDKEFEDCYCEVKYESDTDSMPSLESNEDFDTELWRRDLAVRDEVDIKISSRCPETLQVLNEMGWGLDGWMDGSNGLIIKCKVVYVIDEPLEGMAPFLLKPKNNRNLLELQAYQPRSSEIHNLTHIAAPRDELRLEAEVESQLASEEDLPWSGAFLTALIARRKHEYVLKKKICEARQDAIKPTYEITSLICNKIDIRGYKKKEYKIDTRKSLIHKITMDVILEHKNELKKEMDDLNVEYDDLLPLPIDGLASAGGQTRSV